MPLGGTATTPASPISRSAAAVPAPASAPDDADAPATRDAATAKIKEAGAAMQRARSGELFLAPGQDPTTQENADAAELLRSSEALLSESAQKEAHAAKERALPTVAPKLTVAMLRSALEERSLDASGLKPALVARLLAALN